MDKIVLGIIGGSGLYDLEDLSGVEEVTITTPFGSPSDAYIVGTLEGKRIAFLSRHGKGHRILPTEVNVRANIFGFKKLAVERIISAGAVGSMKESIAPLDIVLPDQFFDRTSKRSSTFFGDGIVGHITFADPICEELRAYLMKACENTGSQVHNGGTYMCIEGPQFSTRAESFIYRQWGVDVIGMTNLQEAKLSREAEICFATMALVTDYDCWHESEESVTIEAVIQNLLKNAVQAKKIIKRLLQLLPEERSCPCREALKDSIITERKRIPEKIKKKLHPIIGKYL